MANFHSGKIILLIVSPPSAQFPWDFASSWGRGIYTYNLNFFNCIYHNIFSPQREGIQVSFPNYGLF
jgi:hypothetical protein